MIYINDGSPDEASVAQSRPVNVYNNIVKKKKIKNAF